MKNRIFKALALVLLISFTLSACEVTVDHGAKDVFEEGEYTAIDDEIKMSIAEKIATVAENTEGKNLIYVSDLGLTITTEGKMYTGGVSLRVLKDPSGEAGATYTYFTFGGYSGRSNYLKDEFFIYSVDEEQTTYVEERATLNRSDEKTVNSVKYKKTDYYFDVYEFLGEKGYDFNFFGGADVTDIRMFAALLYYDDAEIYSCGTDRIKVMYTFPEDRAETVGYEGCAYYVWLGETDYSIKVVMTYHTEEGELKETDKTVLISTTSERIVLPTDLDEYEDRTAQTDVGQAEEN